MTILKPQTAQTDDRTQFCILFLIFKLPWGLHYVPMVENNDATELASCFSRAKEKYANIDGRYHFEPVAVETLGVINTNYS